jgi:hypothetical protein
MKWPTKSPDLNPIENVWGLLVRRVYDGGRQVSTIEELKRAILHDWKALDKNYLRKFVDSMPKRCL